MLLGVTLDASGWSTTEVGVLLAAILAGTAVLSFVVGRYAERVGRRRTYASLFVGLAVAGLAFGLTTNFVVLAIVALIGTLSTEVVESGPFTSLEQAMLPETVEQSRRTRMFGVYNAVATIAGSFGALAAGGPELLREAGFGVPSDHRFFLVLVPVGFARRADRDVAVDQRRSAATTRSGRLRRFGDRGRSCCASRVSSRSTASAAASSCRASSCSSCPGSSAWRRRSSASSSSPSGSCRPARSWPRRDWPSGSGC